MIPPLPTVNDAIGLLAALSDPVKSKAILDEVKAHTTTANEAMTKVQRLTRELEAAKAEQEKVADKLGKERMAFAEMSARHATQRDSDIKSMADREKALTDRANVLAIMIAKVNERQAAQDARDGELNNKKASLDAREGVIIAKEARADGLMKTFKPIMDQLR